MKIRALDVTGDDLKHALSIVNADHAAVISEALDTLESLRDELTSPESLVAEHRIAFDDDGTPIGVLAMSQATHEPLISCDVYCLPEAKPQLSGELIACAQAIARRIVNGRSGWQLEAACYAEDEVLIDALMKAGMRHVRSFWTMTKELAGDERVSPPAGASLIVARSENDRRLMHSVFESAFLGHFGSSPHRYEEFVAWFERGPVRPELWWLVTLDGSAVAAMLSDERGAELGKMQVRSLGVLEAARGRGIATWLLRELFAVAVEMGKVAVTLQVDTENATGATKLYEDVGMRASRTIPVFRQDVT